jgi:GAF domain-containing protein/anti-sigma regulatory factor (Ser/Thr protein kinase)
MAGRSKSRKTSRRTARKAASRKPAKPTGKVSAKSRRRNRPAIADLEAQLKRRADELTKARERQAATAEVLQIISSSSGNLKPVFESMLAKAMHLCEAQCGFIYQIEQGAMRAMAEIGVPPALAEYRRHHLHTGGATTPVDVMRATKKPAHVHDARDSDAYRKGNPNAVAGVDLGGARTVLYVPMIRDDDIVGVINLYRQEVRPFRDEQIVLVEHFASQAVVAIENARLFNETREALERQTATASILRVIASSPSNLRPVFEAIAARSVELVGGHSAAVSMFVGDRAELGAFTPVNPEADAALAALYPRRLTDYPLFALVQNGEVAQVSDMETDPRVPMPARITARGRGFRSLALVPMNSDGGPIGLISVTRKLPGMFAAHHIQLMQTFADQAVIAIKNTRLFEEVQAKTRDLEESLQFQTASSDVLKAISNSPDSLQPVLDVIVGTSRELCGSDAATIFLLRDRRFHVAAMSGPLPPHLPHLLANPLEVEQPGSILSRAAREKRTLHYANVMDDPELSRGVSGLGGPRALLAVPLVTDGKVIGVIFLRQSHLRPFTRRQIQAIETFADQAVIAIQNVKLFEEVQVRTADLTESLQQQTSTAEVLGVIASSPTDVMPVLNAIVKSACQLCEASDAYVALKHGDDLVFQAHHGSIPVAWKRRQINRQWPAGRAVIDGEPVHVRDIMAREGDEFPDGREIARRDGAHSVLTVPLMREGESVGVIILRRIEIQPFTNKQIALLKTFADQAVIAIGNVRLFDEVQARTRELSQSLDDLRAAQDRLIQTEKLASLGQLTAGIAHEIKNPLNFVNNFSALSTELIDELNGELARSPIEEKLRKEIGELTGMLKSNLEKVVQHGRRADAIVKNMLLHSRAGSGEQRSADVNALVEESLNLAYHGARAEKSGFNITLERNFDPDAGTIEVFPQEITRVLLNLISNGFYAATKRKSESADVGFEPVVGAATRNLGNRIEIRIRDNGAGIPPGVREKIFNPFFTTKPAGEGTGLGLSMSHDIIVKQHGGTIDVDTEPGSFTEFIVTLRRKGAPRATPGDRT